MWYGLCWLSNLVHVIKTCRRYLCSSSLSSHLAHRYQCHSLPSPLYEAMKKDGAWASNADSRCCSADRQERERKEGEEENRGRQKEIQWDSEEERAEKRCRRGRVFCVCSCLGDKEDGEQNVLYVHLWVYLYILCMCCSVQPDICAHKLLNAFAWLYGKKRSYAERWRGLFSQWDGGSFDLNTESVVHKKKMRLLSPMNCSSTAS